MEQSNVAAAQLLRLLSFFNPDGILTDFLHAGSDGLNDDLKTIIAEPDTFLEALSELKDGQ